MNPEEGFFFLKGYFVLVTLLFSVKLGRDASRDKETPPMLSLVGVTETCWAGQRQLPDGTFSSLSYKSVLEQVA